ncbi:hypothetical protein [Crocinitomix catalasitica]|uniref:hypothetical protein n=1 Tax=Crocinitomix catalasitica TaxID=184607 RepID=UPI00048A0FB1|nr:hypothetical protein [Crocinitomix catalasitica]
MKTNIFKFILALGLFCFGYSGSNVVYSQVDVTYSEYDLVKVNMKDGSFKTGFILSDDGREILLNSREVGKIYLPKSDIKNIVILGDEADESTTGEVTLPPSFNTRYHFTTNSLPLKKGEHYAMINLYGPEVHLAPLDNLSIGIMTTWMASPFVLALKYTIPTNNKNINFGLGTLFGTSGYWNAFANYGGLYWGMVTFGDADLNLTLSAGYSHFDTDGLNSFQTVSKEGIYYGTVSNPAYPEQETVKNNNLTAPAFSVGFAAKIGKNATFIMDGMFFMGKKVGANRIETTETIGVNQITTVKASDKKSQLLYLMPGMRFQSKPSRAFQISLAGVSVFKQNIGSSETYLAYSFPIPMVSWFFRF